MLQVIGEFTDENFFLSNFAPCPKGVMYQGELYHTSEHAYQAAKTLDATERKQIRSSKDPGVAKRLGRALTVQSNWDSIKIRVMEEIVYDKFTRDEDLRDLLLGTDDSYLVEGNTWGDKIWGVCDGQGENHLGKVLMRVRQKIKDESHDLLN